ncbi:hypothetical protein FMM05_19370 [Flavobacterium zepuense]|uniref:Uncharacterized protein n=1 Tax=Flavobacterium zepuense TaxID=2593302 RepID=A0A552UUQ2_9FLAO|nr:hypothetical protein [Flavobacterium zepuense]TRW21951.1 hypothetical protein FMM05_19370 [Flavobacterium zepuense]
MGDFAINNLRYSGYDLGEENPEFKKDALTVNKQNRYEVLSFCLYIIDKYKFEATDGNLHRIERLLHHVTVDSINNKKDLLYFVRRNWKMEEE